MTDLLGIGASAVATYRGALGIVGDNVANAETPGYARRGLLISESPVASASSPLNRANGSLGGATTAAVTRAWDEFKATDARDATSDAGRASAAATWLDTAGDAIDDTDNGVGAKITSVFTAADQFAGNPTSATARTQMFYALGDATQAIAASAKQLGKVAGGIADTATAGVTTANNDLTALAKLNAQLVRTPDGTEAKASLADQRDHLLDDLSGQLGIDATVASDGTVAVALASGGAPLLTGTRAAPLAVAAGTDGRLGFTLGTAAIAPTSGALAGLATAADGVATTRASLDTIATGLADRLNAWNAAGRTAAGTAGQPLLDATGGAAGLTVVATSGAAIAAAGADGTANGNLLTLSDLRGSDGAETQLATLVGANAQALASAKAQSSAADTRKSAALVARDDVSGVSLDQEAADLVRYQQAYDGSAKIIQAAQTTLQAILALF